MKRSFFYAEIEKKKRECFHILASTILIVYDTLFFQAERHCCRFVNRLE